MDMSGAGPDSAWVEIRDAAGELLVSIPASVDGGSIMADLPAFPPNTVGSVQVCTERNGKIDRDPRELKELATSPGILFVEMG
jgi:hypothetical protein